MTQEDLDSERRVTHATKVRNFYYHLVTFIWVNTLMALIDVQGGAGANAVLGLDWAYWLILFWGLGVAGHAISVFFDDRAPEAEQAKAKVEISNRV